MIFFKLMDILTLSQASSCLHLCEHELAWLDMSIILKKIFCLRVGPRCDATCVYHGWRKYGTSGCTLSNQGRSSARWTRPSADFFVPLMLFFGKVGRVASVEVVLEV